MTCGEMIRRSYTSTSGSATDYRRRSVRGLDTIEVDFEDPRPGLSGSHNFPNELLTRAGAESRSQGQSYLAPWQANASLTGHFQPGQRGVLLEVDLWQCRPPNWRPSPNTDLLTRIPRGGWLA